MLVQCLRSFLPLQHPIFFHPIALSGDPCFEHKTAHYIHCQEGLFDFQRIKQKQHWALCIQLNNKNQDPDDKYNPHHLPCFL